VDLSVVVPTYRRPELLRRCLDSLRAQDVERDRFEVVVVDDGSGDSTAQVLNMFDVIGVVQAENRGPAAARNVGLATATGELVLFLDDDVAAAPDLVSTHLRLHAQRDDPLLGVLGRVDWDPSLQVTNFMHWLDRSGLQFAYDTWLREGAVAPPYAAFYTANLSMHRALLADVGGFDERFPYAAFEDIELAFRLAGRGFHLDYQPSAQAFHTRAIELEGFCRRMEKVGESAELMRVAAPEFPLDDSTLTGIRTTSSQRLRLRVRAALGRHDAWNAYCWARVAAAYDGGRRRARS